MELLLWFTANSFARHVVVSHFLSHQKEVSLTQKQPVRGTQPAVTPSFPGKQAGDNFQNFAPTRLSSSVDVSECGLQGIILFLPPKRCLRNSKCCQERHDYQMVPLLSPQTVKWKLPFKPQHTGLSANRIPSKSWLSPSQDALGCPTALWVICGGCKTLWGSGNGADINTPSPTTFR